MARAAAPAVPAVDATATTVARNRVGKTLQRVVIAGLLLALCLGGGMLWVLKQRSIDAAALLRSDDAETRPADAPPLVGATAMRVSNNPPVFVPLEPFVVNLADRDVDRFAQIGVTLQVEDAKFAEALKMYLPAVRSGILMVLAHKTSQQLLDREGKDQLVAEIMRESVRPMGIHIEVDEPAPVAAAAAAAAVDAVVAAVVVERAASAAVPFAPVEPTPTTRASAPAAVIKKKAKPVVHNPVLAVNFSSFIIQ